MNKQRIARIYLAILLVAAVGLIGTFLVSTLGAVPVLVFVAICVSVVWAAANM